MLVPASTSDSSPSHPNEFDIRPISYDDARVVAHLREYLAELESRDEALREETAASSIDETQGANALASEFVSPSGLFLGAFRNDVLCGIGGVRCYTDGETQVGEIKRMFLRPVVRGRGLSRQLLSLLEDAAVAFGCTVARLDTRSSLTEARALYASHGYREIVRYNDNPFAQHFFEKDLRLDVATLRRFAAWTGIDEEQLPSQSMDLSRRLGLTGSFNFRDVGGYVGHNAMSLRESVVYRSDHLNTLTDNDLKQVRERNIASVYDFRLNSERERQPSRFANGWNPEVHLLSTSDTQALDDSVVDLIREALAGLRPMPAPSFWEEAYEAVLAAGRPMFVAMLSGLADETKLPALFHCSGGKDRTGIATALLHRILGVDDEDIIDDFLATNLYRTPIRLLALRQGLLDAGIDPAQAIPIIGVMRSGIVRALQLIDESYGGAIRYLVDGGMNPTIIEQLRARLLC